MELVISIPVNSKFFFFFNFFFLVFFSNFFKGLLKRKEKKTQHLKFCCSKKNFNQDKVFNLMDNNFQLGIYREI